ncbi:MAG: SDR family oxidoreductase [Acidimicrobiia bacterium]|nr:MAG: SDR family oxidoreductase [Acidimicrobiia bacterium]
MNIREKVILITGGAGGIGAAMARRFNSAGAGMIVVTDIDARGAQAVAESVGGEGIALDVTNEDQTRSVIEHVEASYGRIDLLCLNAGIPTDGSIDAPNVAWQRTWEVNVMAHVYATRHALPGMLDRGAGYILTTASAAGLLTNIGAAPYSVTKHAAVALAEWLAVTYGQRGITVSCLCPMFVDTPMLDAFGGHTAEMQSWVHELAISAEDVADAVAEGIVEERFLILPHPIVGQYFRRKATDYDRWIAGMQDLQASVGPGVN